MTKATTLDLESASTIQRALAAARMGRLGEACEIGEGALASGGDPVAFNAMLGMLRSRAGDLDRGIAHFREAHSRKPADLTIAFNLISALVDAERAGEALEAATEELAFADPSLRIARYRGFLAQQAEDYPAAIKAYEHVVARDPDDFDSWNNLGNARRATADFEGSVAALRRAVEINSDAPPIRLNLAMAIGAAGDVREAEGQLRSMAEDYPDDTRSLRELHALLKEQGRDEEALEAIDSAARRDPSNIEILLALASHQLFLLQNDSAEASYRRVLDLDAANGLANLGLAVVFELTNRTEQLSNLVSEAKDRGVDDLVLNFIRAFDHRRAKRYAEGLAALEQVPSELETQRRAHLLGQMLEGGGRYDEAFAAFSRMNELGGADASRPEERGAALRARVRSQLDLVTPEWVGSWREGSIKDERPSPVFLVGFPRSGTTLLDTMLMGHPQIEVLEEEPALRDSGRHLPDFAALPTASDEQIQAARDSYFETAASLTPLKPGNLLIDKNPLTMNSLPSVYRLFPDARIILALRHPCDVVLSCFITNFRLNDGMASFLRLDTAAELYDLSFSFAERVQELMKFPMHKVIYENVVGDRERELRSLFEFLELDWSDQVLEHEATARGRGRIKTASYSQVVEPIYARASGRWKSYREHLEPVLPILRPWVEKFGYSLDDSSADHGKK